MTATNIPLDQTGSDDVALAERMKQGRDRILRRAAQADRRPGRRDRAGADLALRRRQQHHHRRARPGQDPDHPHPGPGAGPQVLAHPVHAGPDAVGHHGHGHHPGGPRDRPAPSRLHARPDLRQHRAGRRDQPHAAQDAVRAAGGDAGAPRDRAGQDLHAGGAVLRLRDPEPDRAGGDLPAARGAARPVHVRHRDRLPAGGAGDEGGGRDHRHPGPALRAHGDRRRHRGLPGPGAPRAGGGRGHPLRRGPGPHQPPLRARSARVREEVGRVRRQRPRRAVPRPGRQGARPDAGPLQRQLRGHPRPRPARLPPSHPDQLPRGVGAHQQDARSSRSCWRPCRCRGRGCRAGST